MKSSAPILIIDKKGLIGEPLALKLSKEFQVVSVCFWRKFPTIPDNKYSHIVVIDEEGLILEFLPKIIKKAKDVNADFIAVFGLSANSQKLISKILNLYSTAKVAIYGNIVEDMPLIHSAQKFKKMQVAGDGLRPIHPIFINDAVNGLIDVIFNIHKSHFLFYIFPRHPVTELSLAHTIQKNNPEITIDFVKHAYSKKITYYPPYGKYLLDDKYPLVKKIRSIDLQSDPSADVKNKDDQSLSKSNKKLVHPPFFIIWILILLIFMPLFFTLLFSSLGWNYAKSSKRLSNAFFYIGKEASRILYFQGKIAGLEDNIEKLLQDLDLGYRINSVYLQASNAGDYFVKVLGGKSKKPIADFTNAKNNLKSSIAAFNSLQAEDKISTSYLKEIKNIEPLIKLLSNTQDMLPNIFGLEGQRTYLILFQNNLNIRPGGGLIDSYGILKLNMGKITEFSVHDIDDADNKLRGHVEPPYGLRRHLPSSHWYLRDSNFDVDFVKSSSASSNLYFAEEGKRVSGVIGVDLTFIKNILRAIGPIYLFNYQETINDDNLYLKVYSHNEKDFLQSIYKEVFKITANNVSYDILQAISDSLIQKHLMLVLNSNLQNIFTVNGWSSSISDERRNKKNLVNDFLGISEANLGVNKVNYFISRKATHKVMIGEDGIVSSELNISYKNSSKLEKEDYKNYLRLILPQNAVLSEISIQDVLQNITDAITDPLIYEDKTFNPPIGLEVEKIGQDSKTIYGFLVRVPAGELVKIKIKYELADKIPDINAFSYSLKLFKQPGMENLPYSFSLTYPNNLNVLNTTAGLIKEEKSVSYAEKINKDINLSVDFAKK